MAGPWHAPLVLLCSQCAASLLALGIAGEAMHILQRYRCAPVHLYSENLTAA